MLDHAALPGQKTIQKQRTFVTFSLSEVPCYKAFQGVDLPRPTSSSCSQLLLQPCRRKGPIDFCLVGVKSANIRIQVLQTDSTCCLITRSVEVTMHGKLDVDLTLASGTSTCGAILAQGTDFLLGCSVQVGKESASRTSTEIACWWLCFPLPLGLEQPPASSSPASGSS